MKTSYIRHNFEEMADINKSEIKQNNQIRGGKTILRKYFANEKKIWIYSTAAS